MTPEEFLAARLDEDEAAARASVGEAVFSANTGEWVVAEPSDAFGSFTLVFAVAKNGARTQVADLTAAHNKDERVVHIARHDPARVLRQVQAHRALLEDHSDRHVCEDTMAGPTWNWDADGKCEIVADPCRVLRAILEIWSDHPDYDAKWSEDQ